jgi:hypothetical protein
MEESNYAQPSGGNKTMSAEDMWNTIKGQNAFGIEGYEIPRFYADPRKNIDKRRLEEIAKDALKHPKKYFPPRKNDEVIVFKRPNYLDDVRKIINLDLQMGQFLL